MMQIRLLSALLSTVLCFALSPTTAGAEDSGSQPAARPATTSLPFDWSGSYAGVTAGAAFGRSTATDVGDGLSPASAWYLLGGQFSNHAGSFSAAAQAGYNFQAAQFVFGAEAEIGYLGKHRVGNYAPLDADTLIKTRGGPFGTLRGRLGFAMDRALFYGTAGAIVADVGSNVSRPSTDFFTSKTGTQFGWTAGVGVEYAMRSNWSIKAEYFHYDLGSTRVKSPPMFVGGVQVMGPQPFDIRNTGGIARIGLNYRF
ncbi:outer membrane beta-barrel protein [Mesorhizobium sp. WSM4884]|uniref:outer membrane protein n=1 Tax=Mesorhizobium sp. WSM4884 TaxID=3038542 RepID=UPI0024168334|nr:outer membrane beta-barrel protein [Mesorhizobium sp. WSM4884]MDG4880765.1 outer membrane beta-barrel protein [Mesorhizobium sp. WSM4884]